jgi:hypothetical protein
LAAARANPAEGLGRSPEAVRKLIHRALKEMRGLLGDRLD